MKTLTATLAAIATVATLSAAPAMAESTVVEQQAKLQRILNGGADYGHTVKRAAPSKQKSQAISTTMLSGPEAALRRLLAVQPDAATGGR